MSAAVEQAVKERPIIFGAESVKAILEGRKTQTRRVMKPQPAIAQNNACAGPIWEWKGVRAQGWRYMAKAFARLCPYGQAGDRLWVRESWAHLSPESLANFNDARARIGRWNPEGNDYDGHSFAVYYADGNLSDFIFNSGYNEKWAKTSPIHMPRWASRLTLEITAVRVERLQSLTPHDACAEGVTLFCQQHVPSMDICHAAFAQGWDELNAKRGFGWDANPFVWVVEFKRLTATD